MHRNPEVAALKQIYLLIAVSVIISSFSGCVAGSCLSYGHSCWGAHGKRSGQLDRRPEDASTSWTDRRLLQPRYFATGDDGSPSVLLSRLLRHPSEQSTQRLMRSMTSARQFEQEAPPAPPLMIIDGDDLPDASFSKRSSPLEKIANDGGMGHILRDNPKMADQLSSNDIVHSRPKESNIKNDQEMTLGLYKLLKNIDNRINGASM